MNYRYMEELDGAKRAGTFAISPERNIYGELTYGGRNTSLRLSDEQYLDVRTIQSQGLKGTLQDLTKVTLLECITTSVPGSVASPTERRYFADVFPHFVLHGDCHVSQDEKVIDEVHFLVDDASAVFYDFDAFGSVIDARPFIEQIVRANRLEREIQTGPYPQILYFTGKHEILSVDTVLGKITVAHRYTHKFAGPDGVRLDNRIFISLKFKELCSFDRAICDTIMLLRFVELVAGRPQNLLSLEVYISSDGPVSRRLTVYWSMRPKREFSDGISPQPSDIPVNGGMQPDSFARVMRNWLERDEARRDARLRFSSSFGRQGKYGIDRLIASANMFDILPDAAVPPNVVLSDEMKSARDKARSIFSKLPVSPGRDSVLNVLGRIGQSALKNKVRHRVRVLCHEIPRRFPDLFMVTDEAVNCRNYYVHGGDAKFDYNKEFHLFAFLTDTLEFVFAASDLIEAGWDIKAWLATPTSMSHPFGRYRVNYAESLQRLRSVLT